jgi:peptidoglycan/xylan/chitin deacetylase (PgdA/CDA1 family)
VKRVAALAISLAVRFWDVLAKSVRPRRRQTRGAGVVLYYHGVKRHQRERFARQMDHLLWRSSPFRAEAPASMRADGWNAAVTFDDGFQSVVENAVPELTKRGIPFTVFVPSGCLGARPSWIRDPRHPAWDERIVTTSELRALAALPLATVGSHSITHPNLRALDATCVRRELAQSRLQLQSAAGAAIEVFSFPHGAYSPGLLTEARRAGYRRVFTIEPLVVDRSQDSFAIGRVAADPDDWSMEFRLKLAGAYRWRCHLHRQRHAISKE